MSNSETVQAVFAAVEARVWDAVDGLVGDEFQHVAGGAPPETKAQWVDRHKALGAAFSDFAYNAQNYNAENDEVTAFVAITGTHDGPLDLPAQGVIGFGATGKRVELPQEMIIAKVEGGKVTHLVVHGPDHGGVAGLLEQIGAPT